MRIDLTDSLPVSLFLFFNLVLCFQHQLSGPVLLLAYIQIYKPLGFICTSVSASSTLAVEQDVVFTKKKAA